MKRTVQPRRGAKAQAGVAAGQLAALSHEFRTPLNGVLGMARLLEGTRLTAEQRAYVAALRESGEHLLGLVNDLLDFAKLGEGKVELHPAPVDVEALLRQVCELLSPRAREKGLEIAWAVPPAAGRMLAAQRFKITGTVTETGKPIDLDLWYADNGELVKMHSIADSDGSLIEFDRIR